MAVTRCRGRPTLQRSLDDGATRAAWALRYGWAKALPPYLASAATRIRKVEFTDARDIKELMWKGSDGVRETTWPGVYNRSRLPGRHDYFELPDWNVYAVGGKALTLTLPDEPWNRIEILGAAHGSLTYVGAHGETHLGERAEGLERTSTALAQTLEGGKLRFDNAVQETPIQEIAAYYVAPGEAPKDALTLSYTVNAAAAADNPNLAPVVSFIDGRYLADERAIAVALPDGAPMRTVSPRSDHALPLVHVLIPADFRTQAPGLPLTQYAYGWENLNAGLDGIAIDLPALNVKATQGGLFPLNIRVMDPPPSRPRADRHRCLGEAGRGAHALARHARPPAAERQESLHLARRRRRRFRPAIAERHEDPPRVQGPRRGASRAHRRPVHAGARQRRLLHRGAHEQQEPAVVPALRRRHHGFVPRRPGQLSCAHLLGGVESRAGLARLRSAEAAPPACRYGRFAKSSI